MDEDDKYRLEEAEEGEKRTGIGEPLPKEPIRRQKPIVNFLGISMPEDRRDLIVFLLTPLIVALIDTAIYARIVTGEFPNAQIFLFLLPTLAAIPMGMLLPKPGRSLIGAFLTAVFFVILFILFLVSPSFYDPAAEAADFFFSAVVLSSVYFIWITVASLLGTFAGILLREFA